MRDCFRQRQAELRLHRAAGKIEAIPMLVLVLCGGLAVAMIVSWIGQQLRVDVVKSPQPTAVASVLADRDQASAAQSEIGAWLRRYEVFVSTLRHTAHADLPDAKRSARELSVALAAIKAPDCLSNPMGDLRLAMVSLDGFLGVASLGAGVNDPAAARFARDAASYIDAASLALRVNACGR